MVKSALPLNALPLDDPRLVKGLKRLFFKCMFLAAAWIVLWNIFHWRTPSGYFSGQDFVLFWAASKLALAGQAQSAYDPAAYGAVIRQVMMGYDHVSLYYPPVALLLFGWWALLPYFWSWLIVAMLTTGLLVWVVRKICPAPLLLWGSLSAPAVMLNAWGGQNGALSAALIGLTLLLLRTRPALAGICLGLLCYKPQMAALLLLLLLFNGYWKTLIAACVTAICACGLTTLIFGRAIWSAWFESMQHLSAYLQPGNALMEERIPYERMASIYGAVRNMGLDAHVALMANMAGALTAVILVALIWRRKQIAFECKATAALFGTLLATPYLYFYDYPLSLVGLAFWLAHALPRGVRSKEYLLIAAIWLMPAWLVIGTTIALPVPSFVLLYAIAFLLRAEKTPPIF